MESMSRKLTWDRVRSAVGMVASAYRVASRFLRRPLSRLGRILFFRPHLHPHPTLFAYLYMDTESDAPALPTPPASSYPPLPTLNTEVLVVGAGPTGLSVALGLAKHGVPFLLVDGAAEGHNASKAVWLQPSALEALERFSSPLADVIVANSVKSPSFPTVDVHGRPIFSLEMRHLADKTKYPYCFLIPQHRVERKIREALGPAHGPHWGKKVIDLREVASDKGVGAKWEAVFESGEVVTAKYIVAADGTRSTIRTLSKMHFNDPITNKPLPGTYGGGPRVDLDQSFVVADVVFEEPIPANTPRDSLQVVLGGGGMLITAPLVPEPGMPNLFRMYLGITGLAPPPPRPDAAFVQEVINRRGPGSHDTTQGPPPKIAKVLDASRYRLVEGLAESYIKQADAGGAFVLLAGDAAHRHGPAGGQGMNVGICDGCELADAIAEHVFLREEKPSAGPFQTYNNNRRSAAKQVIAMVRDMTQAERGEETWVAWAKLKALGLALKVPKVNAMMAYRVSGLGYAKERL
ncbi:FAD/NAD(P)-binding domain-containing protein [Mycena chlorophos]|uniref:FAD/NAD(P)-binding domain-containing protein n=1 Tax=Mycena chlorophos TaxID=658473 RepID=A0A8H6WKN7_MYCCL|nr:FAD/NAD(P)-binding domain-containing protein [Mycena chlorophos]